MEREICRYPCCHCSTHIVEFPICELFPKDEPRVILDMFATAVTVTVERKMRQGKKKANQLIMPSLSRKNLKGRVYEVDERRGKSI